MKAGQGNLPGFFLSFVILNAVKDLLRYKNMRYSYQ